MPLGTIGLCVATPEGISAPLSLLVDSLPSVTEAVTIIRPSPRKRLVRVAIDAASDGKLYDYFRFHALADQSIAFEVLASHLVPRLTPWCDC